VTFEFGRKAGLRRHASPVMQCGRNSPLAAASPN
jgi:hypothetical protein